MATRSRTINEAVAEARSAIITATNISYLFKIGQSISGMGFDESVLEELRSLYSDKRRELQTTIKAEELSGLVVELQRPRYIETSIGPSFMLRGNIEQSGKPFECWAPGSSNGPVHRFFERRAPVAYPVRCIMTLGAHPTDRNKTMWQIEILPPANTGNSIPF